MSARESILGKLRAAPSGAAPVVPDVTGWYARHTAKLDSAERVVTLRKALEAVRTEVHEVTNANWIQVLLQIAAAKKMRQLLIGVDTPHGDALAAQAGPDLQILRYEQAVDAWQELLFDGVDAALTLARGAIAEIGSLILWPTPAEPRLMSLVPSLHFVLLDADTIHVNLFSALNAEGWSQGMPTNALLICGPSKTADIQQTLAYGAHGPRELVVLIRQHKGAQS